MAYKMTPARRAALKKAQAASARKRKGKKNSTLAKAHARSRRNAKVIAATGGLALAAAGVAGAYYAQPNRKGNKKPNYDNARKEARNRINRRRALRASVAQMRGVITQPDPVVTRRDAARYAIGVVFGGQRKR